MRIKSRSIVERCRRRVLSNAFNAETTSCHSTIKSEVVLWADSHIEEERR